MRKIQINLKWLNSYEKTYKLSELFNTSSAHSSKDQIYSWGYLAVRYMMENQRDKIETMLDCTRRGDYPRYQALVKAWSQSMDTAFDRWLETL